MVETVWLLEQTNT